MSYVVQFILNGVPYRYRGKQRGFAPNVPGWVYDDKDSAVAAMGALRRSSLFAAGGEFAGCGDALHLADPRTGKRVGTGFWQDVTEVERRRLDEAAAAERHRMRMAEWRARRKFWNQGA